MSRTDLLDKYSHPGKFEGEINLTAVLYEMGLEGCGDEAFGEVDGFGFFEFHDLTGWDGGNIGEHKAAILHHDNQGFVYGEYFSDLASGKKAWSELEAEYLAWGEQCDEYGGCTCFGINMHDATCPMNTDTSVAELKSVDAPLGDA